MSSKRTERENTSEASELAGRILELPRFDESSALCVVRRQRCLQPRVREQLLNCSLFSAMATSTVPLELPGCRLDDVQAIDGGFMLHAQSTARSASCPDCGRRSRCAHGFYTRSPADLPVSDQAVRLRLRVRRFRCGSAACPRKTFVAPLMPLVAPHARRTARLADALTRVGFAVGAEPGARLLTRLRMQPGSPDTVLRLMHRHPIPTVPTPRVLGTRAI